MRRLCRSLWHRTLNRSLRVKGLSLSNWIVTPEHGRAVRGTTSSGGGSSVEGALSEQIGRVAVIARGLKTCNLLLLQLQIC